MCPSGRVGQCDWLGTLEMSRHSVWGSWDPTKLSLSSCHVTARFPGVYRQPQSVCAFVGEPRGRLRVDPAKRHRNGNVVASGSTVRVWGGGHRCSESPFTAVHPGAQKIQNPLHTVSTATSRGRKEAAAADGKAPFGEGLPRRGAALWAMSRARRTPAAPACSVGASTLTSPSQEQEPEALRELS